MKKFILIVITILTLSSTTYADLLNIGAGIGSWNQTPEGFMEYKDTANDNSGRDTSNENSVTNIYTWFYIKHYFPYVPNIRMEYSSIESDGQGSGTLTGFEIPIGSNFPTTLEMNQFEIIPYYNLLDDSFFINVDIGLAIKFIDYQATGRLEIDIGGMLSLGNEVYNEKGDFIAPLPYLRVRTQLPFNIGAETTLKYGALDGSSFTDLIMKIDYTLDFFPIIKPGFELGYKLVDLDAEVEDGDTTSIIKLTFSGIFIGLLIDF